MDPFDLEWQAQVEEERAESDWLGRWLQQNDRTVNTGPLQPMPLNQDGTEIKPTNNFEFASDEQRMAFFAGLKSGTIKVGDDRPPKGVTEYRKGNPKDETVRKTRMAYNKVMKQVTPKAREIIQRNQRSLVHHESLDELTKSFVDITGQALPAGQKVGGYYHPRQGSVNLDGPARGGRLKDDYKYERNQDSQTHMMAHELAHAVDHGGSLSQQEEWNEAWRSEIKRSDAPITNYATTHPAEGFAEFFRIATIYGSEDVKDKFPKCYEFMKKRGLLE
jgi:hypothetical protein